jgi:predicted HTH domain antitoxin
MQIEVPDNLGVTKQELVEEIAISLFQQGKVTLAKAAELADMTRIEFQRLLARREIPVNYSVEDLYSDIQVLRKQGEW